MPSPDFLISDKAAEEFYNSLKPICLNTGTDRLPSFGKESSFLSTKSTPKRTSNIVLAIDIGGTRTKVCVRNSSGSEVSWQEILDLDNAELQTENSGVGKGLTRMAAELCRRIASECRSKSISTSFDGTSIVWSNKLQCYALSGAIKGVGAKVFGCKTGQAYRKGEWWNSDIADGDDISQAFLNGLSLATINTKILIVGNDTVFTAKALPGSSGGVVSSTGANTTIIPTNSHILFNSECAAAIELNSHFLNLRKTSAGHSGSSSALKLEDVCAGKGLPQVYLLLLDEAAAQGQVTLNIVANILKTKTLTSKEVAEIALGKLSSVLSSRQEVEIDPQTSKNALEIAKQLIHNAGTMCAVLILISVSNQLGVSSEFLVALDSSQARFVPGYKESVDSFLNGWNARNNKKVAYALLEPQGNISVPLRGAANAIEEFL